ncbi:HVO_2523 family zinc finger protein [Halomicrococcus sp. NG-SE-24]|uniref:HVO_2523 family zinc finger protein n=1 Tax=Halomicrococcus sp. NG-SE-24 TaxID=3436928 RepID=UPI003D951BE1
MGDETNAGEESDRDGAAATDATEVVDDATGGRPCPTCQEPMFRRHCKYVCPNHGVVMDCGDTFWN